MFCKTSGFDCIINLLLLQWSTIESQDINLKYDQYLCFELSLHNIDWKRIFLLHHINFIYACSYRSQKLLKLNILWSIKDNCQDVLQNKWISLTLNMMVAKEFNLLFEFILFR